jgi:hypothetical protein
MYFDARSTKHYSSSLSGAMIRLEGDGVVDHWQDQDLDRKTAERNVDLQAAKLEDAKCGFRCLRIGTLNECG